MPDAHLLTVFIIATLTLTLSPGPSNLYIVASTLSRGWQAGVSAALGMAIGSCIYVMLSAAGMSALVLSFPKTFLLIKVCGALYLIGLGWVTIRQANKGKTDAITTGYNDENTRENLLLQSLVVELTNPKTVLFFIAFLPQFTQAGASDIQLQFLVLGGLYTLLAFGSDLFVVTVAKGFSTLLKTNNQLKFWQDLLAGFVLAGLGIFIVINELYFVMQ
ncbi:LysE family translocator [Salinimonas sp. HHU 13199]|uniref:LysE family translocator n=1 Tax=Salinimonas profundi TaxID=2729140 RepID=A0ABR8LLB3_9ALTE|nr:LysE family translocator [Salinimonas profundi]MBD3586998.1 LysE family translocator [Salinimonas profundi]